MPGGDMNYHYNAGYSEVCWSVKEIYYVEFLLQAYLLPLAKSRLSEANKKYTKAILPACD